MAKEDFKIAVRKFDPFSKALEKQWEAFCKSSGYNYRLKAVPFDLNELHKEIIEKKGLKNGDWDLAQVSSDWVQDVYKADAAEDLSSYLDKNPPDRFPEDWPSSLLALQNVEGKILGLPFHDGPECLIYRKDLFEEPQNREKYFKQYHTALKPPATWDKFTRTAAFFQNTDKPLYGTVFAGFPDGHNAVFDFCLQIWSRGGELWDGKGLIAIDTPQAAEGLLFFRKLYSKDQGIHPESRNFESVQAGMSFAKGEVAMMINWFGFASFCEFSEESLVKGKIEITTIPKGEDGLPVSLNSYWTYMIARGSVHKALAYEFIRFALSGENDKMLTKEGGIGCRKSTWTDKEINSRVPYFKKLESLHEHAKHLPPVSYWSEIATIIDEVMQLNIRTEKPVEEILKKGQNEINKILKKHGVQL